MSLFKFVRISDNAFIPKKGTPQSAGYDLRASNGYIIPAYGRELVSTGLIIEMPYGYYGRIAPRSGLAFNNFIDVGAGVIDPDYRGEIKILLYNFGSEVFHVRKGDRVAQLILERFCIEASEIEVDSLETTERGENGFGSTGSGVIIVDTRKPIRTENEENELRIPIMVEQPLEITEYGLGFTELNEPLDLTTKYLNDI